ncbi:glycosyltransferase [Acetobacterium sp. K1/6]|uniref:glycosyltransferase n=1 Tax=Acetobacterium sp. K1/6 TaxID=3055467 RepID=UPI002ACA2EF7|nr:glycosyltransferase [Acetobacterium sp. K1/6]MDZ5724894.1 glycosyltransferase [Acetobacterium sp. K1/6]
MKLSIGMIVKNESKYLKTCLEALKPILKNVDAELVIVDTGSTDNTVEIAKLYTDKVFFHQWNNDFAEARNITIEKSQGEWYFYIDADEILEKPDSIIDFFNKSTYRNYKGLAIKIDNLIKEDRSQSGSTFHSRRIVKRENNLKFTSKIHEYLPKKEPVYLSEAVLVHYGYIQADQDFVDEKSKRNLVIIKEELKADPNNIFLLYHLGQTQVFNGNFIEALDPLSSALNIARESKIYPMHIYNLMLDVYIKNQLFSEAETTAKEVISAKQEENSGYINIYFYLAQAQGILKKNQEAIINYKKCLELLKQYEKNKLAIDLVAIVSDFGGEKYAYSQIAALYDALLDYEKSVEYSKKILALTKNRTNSVEQDYYYLAVNQIVRLSIKYKRYDELVAFYEEILVDKDELKFNVTDRFENTLEDMISNNKKHKIEVINRFAELEINTDYVFLNKIRKNKEMNRSLTEDDVDKIYSYDFNDKNDIYGELVYYLMADDLQIDSVFSKLEEKEINRYNEYMARTFSDFSEVVVKYFKKYGDQQDIYFSIFSKALKRVVLIKEEIDNDDYLDLFKRYVEEGVFYLENVYNETILDTENIYVLKNHEEIFFMFMRKALMNRDRDQSKYLQYMRKALSAYDYMKKGVELLLEELKNEEKKQVETDNLTNNEFEEYKMLVKNNISALVEDNKIAEAKHLIDEYLKIVPVDVEMLALKSEVQLKLM